MLHGTWKTIATLQGEVDNMKMFLIKLLTTLAVFLTMYISIIIVNDDTVENTDEIITLNRKVQSLEETLQAVKQQQEYLQIMHKGLRDALDNRTVEVDRLVEQAVDDKFNEQSATGGFGVLTGEVIPVEEVVEEVVE